MGLAQDLQRYALGRATVRDEASVQAAAALVGDVQAFLLQLDFRNGPLRRRYDGVKYSLKALETFLYELAITGSSTPASTETDSEGRTNKRLKHTASSTLIPTAELDALKSRMDHRDELRETLIKKCRDSQKAAKQCIFALHRGDTRRTLDLLRQCRDAIQKDLMPIVQEEPPLRTCGSFTGVLEEYVEARLFAAWLHGPHFFRDESSMNDANSNDDDTTTKGTLLTLQDFVEVQLEPEEYLGGLCDLTGEIGRYAVQRGTDRDKDSVQACLQTVSSVLAALESLERCPVFKKLEAVRRTEEKMERMLYEMSLSEAAGGRPVQTDVDSEVKDVNMKDGEDAED